MSTPYQRGAAFELRVKADLEANECLVTRSPGSKSPFDLMAVRLDTVTLRPYVYLIQCKLRGVISRAEENELTDVAEAFACRPLLAYTVRERGMIHYKCLLTQRPWTP